MTTTTPPFGPDFYKDLVGTIFGMFDDATRKAYHVLWDALMQLLSQHWILVTIVLILVLISSFVRALSGKWGMFGSVLYNYLYFGTLFIIGLIFGPEVFANNYFKIFLAVLYVACFLFVGKILRKTGLKRH